MPEMHFTIQWPNGKRERCYSPSYIIEEYITPGAVYPVPEFLKRTSEALELASERVRLRYGFACSSALDQLRELNEASLALTSAEREGTVQVLAFEKHPPRDARAKTEEPSQ
jgi:uncharacterized repeat protein (TIGR04042 family)